MIFKKSCQLLHYPQKLFSLTRRIGLAILYHSHMALITLINDYMMSFFTGKMSGWDSAVGLSVHVTLLTLEI